MNGKVVKLRSGRLGRHRPGHPWIYKNQLLKTAFSGPRPGSLVTALGSDGKFIGTGYYNPKSEISVRILTFKEEPINKNFLSTRIKIAFDKRKKLAEKTSAYRVVFSEADAIPGLIVDLYKDTAVFQILTLGAEDLKDVLVECIKEEIKPKFLYEKSTSPYRKMEGLKDFKGWHGEKGNSVIEIFEGNAKFLVDIENGHKTGFYLDQRSSRMAIGQFAKGRRALDLFCYTGAFSVSIAMGGAKEIVGCDIKNDWLELAQKNAALNNVSDKIKFVKGDAFDVLKNIWGSGDKFDMVVIDPPSFLKSKESVKSAARGYKELNFLAMKILNNGGILATFSCSHNMPNEVFSGMTKDAAKDAKKNITILKRCHQAEDHLIVRSIPETEYLKGYFLNLYSVN